jgi:hypothetical protein
MSPPDAAPPPPQAAPPPAARGSALLVTVAILGLVEAVLAAAYLARWFAWTTVINGPEGASAATGDILGRAGMVMTEALLALATSVAAAVSLVLTRTGSWAGAGQLALSTAMVRAAVLFLLLATYWHKVWYYVLEDGWARFVLGAALGQLLCLILVVPVGGRGASR